MPENQSWKFERKGQKSLSFPPFPADNWVKYFTQLAALWISLTSLNITEIFDKHPSWNQANSDGERISFLQDSQGTCCSFVSWNHRLLWDLKHHLIPTCHGQGHFQVFVWVALCRFQLLWILCGFYLSVGTGTGWFWWVWVSQILPPVQAFLLSQHSLVLTQLLQDTRDTGSFLKAEERELH